MVCYAGMIETVQIGTVQYILTFITEYIQVIFQKNLITGQGSGFIHTKNIHAAEALHGVDIFYNGLLFAHGGTAFCKTGINDHGKKLRRQADSYGQGKKKRSQPVAFCDAGYYKHERDERRHKTDQHPCDGIDPLFEAPLCLLKLIEIATVYRINPGRQNNSFPGTADDNGSHEGKIGKAVQGGMSHRVKVLRVLFQNSAFACQQGLGNK